MRSPTQGQAVKTLANQIAVKGTYKYSLTGTHFEVYVLSPTTEILASQHIAVKYHDHEAPETLAKEINRVFEALKLAKMETYQRPPAQHACAEYILRVLFPKRRDN